jgi:hypothetical protein
MHELDTLLDILESFLGESKNGIDDNGQVQFNCPSCSEDSDMPDGDGKFNLEVNILNGKYRCWRCEYTNDMSGKLSNLIKKYGSDDILYKFKEEIKNIKKSKEYELHFVQEDLSFDDNEDIVISFPEKTFDFLFDGNKRELLALNYLNSRGISELMIKKYGIKYTDNYCKNKNFKNRIIVPSYGKYNELNYYTGRDYTGRSFRKYYNLENSNRKEIIFNEHLINWDGDIVLVEGPFDHLVIPNSIPLLGKVINPDFYLFDCIIKKSTQKIIIFLDDDAMADAIKICNKLSCYELCGRLKIVPTNKLLDSLCNNGLNIDKLDPGKLFEINGYKGISIALKMADDFQCI